MYDPVLLQEMAKVLVDLEQPITDTCFMFGVYPLHINADIACIYRRILKGEKPEINRRSAGSRMMMDCIPQTSILWKHLECVGTPKRMIEFTALNGVVGVGGHLQEAIINAVGPAAAANIRKGGDCHLDEDYNNSTPKRKIYDLVKGWNPSTCFGQIAILK